MTGLAEKMKSAGYKTHFAAKWDAGMATPRHTPHGRGNLEISAVVLFFVVRKEVSFEIGESQFSMVICC